MLINYRDSQILLNVYISEGQTRLAELLKNFHGVRYKNITRSSSHEKLIELNFFWNSRGPQNVL